jgi:asparagine synthase (glutamine-hydrolysing)
MCGICGEIRFDGRAPSLDAIGAMNAVQVPRGPEAGGAFAQGAVALGHRRLQIIDVSPRAQQPMVDPELGLAIAYNGAIYNYPALRAELERKGYRFFSSGDTEVILKAWHAWGPEALDRLRGMFAFAILERESGRVVLARDPLGIKPLYLADVDGALRFASSLPALLAAGGVDTALDPVALHHYMSFHSVVPPPRTLLRGVRKLPPGHWMRVEPDGERALERHFELRFETPEEERELPVRVWEKRVLETLRTAVERRLVADVPVGVLLSGGLDSSLLVGLMAEAGQEGLRTFSIGFEGVAGEAGDEFRYSDVIAKHFGTDHHKITVDSKRVLPSLAACVRAMSEPMVSHDVIGFFLLSQEVSHHVKVVQSGQGADEVFAGYHWYPPLLACEDPLADYARVFFDRDHAETARVLAPELLSEDWSLAFVREHFAQPGAPRAIDRALRLDTTVMLVDDPVKRVDNMTMAFGLEARVPFLDRDLVELAARIPAEHKIAGGGKGVLKEAARGVIPAEVIDRPKGYFPVPALKYIRGSYLAFVRQVLDDSRARQRGIVQPAYLEALFREPDAHITPLRGSKLWQVALLETWLQVHGL